MANFILVGKNGFNLPRDLEVPSVLSGHSSLLTPQLIDFLLKRGHEVSLVCPRSAGRSDQIYEAGPYAPNQLRVFPYGDTKFAKTPQSVPLDAFVAAMGAAFGAGSCSHMKTTVISIYGFPFAPMVECLRPAFNFSHLVLLRGGDGDRWLSSNMLQSEYTNFNEADTIVKWYVSALTNADAIFTASEWLATRARSHDIAITSVIPTPPPDLDPTQAVEFGKHVLSKIAKENSLVVEGKKILLFAGRDSPEKRPDLALRAFAEWQDENWVLLMLGIPAPQQGDVSLPKGKNVGFSTVSPFHFAALAHVSHGFIHTSLKLNGFEDARPSAVSIAASAGCSVVFPKNVGGVSECVSGLNQEMFGFDVVHDSVDETTDGIVRSLRNLNCSDKTERVRASNMSHYDNLKPDIIFEELTKHVSKSIEMV